MTSTLIPDPGQASLMATTHGLSSGTIAGPAGNGATPAPAGASAPGGVFSALLLALRPDAAAASGPGEAATATLGEDLTAAVTAMQAPLTAIASASGQPQQSGPQAAIGPGDGEPLPADGNGLPLPEIETLLASLNAPASPTASLPGGRLGLSPDAGSTPTPNPAQRLPLDEIAVTDSLAQSTPPAPAARSEAAGAPAFLATQERTASGEESSGNLTGPARADAATDNASGRTPLAMTDFMLTAEARARPADLLPATRFALAAEASALPFSSVIPNSSAPAGVPAAATPAPMLFDMMPALEPLADRSAWSQGLGERLLMMAERGMQSATLRLQPEHLGPMEIRINVDEDGAAQVLFSAHQAPTREALENAIPRLRELFAEQGLNLTQANVDSGRNAFAQRGLAQETPAWRSWGGDDEASPALADAALWQMRRDPGRRLDVFV